MFLANRLTDFVTMRSIFPSMASRIMLLKAVTVLCIQRRNTLVGIDLDKFPFLTGSDILRVIVDLRIIAGELFVAVRGNTGISGSPPLGNGRCRQVVNMFFVAGIVVTLGIVCFSFALSCSAAACRISDVQLSRRERSAHVRSVTLPSLKTNRR